MQSARDGPDIRRGPVGQVALRFVADLLDAIQVVDPLRVGVAEFVETGPQCVHQIGALPNKAIAGSEQHPLACCSSDFGWTKRISGRWAAITIASASAASFFWRFTKA